jgi:hypothetical protein
MDGLRRNEQAGSHCLEPHSEARAVLRPKRDHAVEVSESSGGSGSVVFRHEITKSSDGDSTLKMAFVGIEDVGNAAREIEQLRLSAQPAFSANGRDHR